MIFDPDILPFPLDQVTPCIFVFTIKAKFEILKNLFTSFCEHTSCFNLVHNNQDIFSNLSDLFLGEIPKI